MKLDFEALESMVKDYHLEGGDGQRHDRIPRNTGRNVALHAGAPVEDVPEYEISIVQKMLSAVVGSVLTSLLGESYATSHMKHTSLTTVDSNTS